MLYSLIASSGYDQPPKEYIPDHDLAWQFGQPLASIRRTAKALTVAGLIHAEADIEKDDADVTRRRQTWTYSAAATDKDTFLDHICVETTRKGNSVTTLDQCRAAIMANDSTPQDRAAALQAFEIMLRAKDANDDSERRSAIAKMVWARRKAVAA